MKQAIAAVYERLQRDQAREDKSTEDHAHFTKWANDHPTEFYKIAAKLLPLQLSGVEDEDGNPQPGVLIRFVTTDAAHAD
jgi:hypothetical protein